mgnify:CR=1 FL=1|tara:strand:- start:1732 stop:2493 length:762 start_codon:yes stop_codon:yes gene_type:complete
MNLKAIKRETKTTGQINKLRSDGFIPAILYGGSKDNLNICLKKNLLKDIIKTESFMSKVFNLDIEGKLEKALPRDVSYDAVSDEPIHIDFMRVAQGSKINLEIPVKFINTEKSPGLKKGGVLNIVRRKVELKCPTESIPEEIVVDLDNTEIGTSIKISSVKLPENVKPTITDRDFVVATVASPTIIVEPVKAEETVEGEVPVEGATEETAAAEGKDKKEGDKEKVAKTEDVASKDAKKSGDKNPAPSKETKKK